MGIHAVMYYDEPNCQELVDVDYQCSFMCMVDTLRGCGVWTAVSVGQRNTEQGSISWGGWPCGSETDYDVYCSGCGEFLWSGLQSRNIWTDPEMGLIELPSE